MTQEIVRGVEMEVRHECEGLVEACGDLRCWPESDDPPVWYLELEFTVSKVVKFCPWCGEKLPAPRLVLAQGAPKC